MADDKINSLSRQRFDDYLRQHRKRRTTERFAILDSVMSTQSHFTIDEFCRKLEGEGMHVAVATVYSTLRLLVDCGLVMRHRFGSESSTYEKVPGAASHHHLICTSCGKVREVRDPEVTRVLRSHTSPGFSIAYFLVNVYGLCARCARRARKALREAAKS